MKRSRRKFTAEFKAKVALEAIKEQKSLSELAEQFELHPNLISIWKREFLENASNVFSKSNDDKRFIAEAEKEKEELFKQIGQLKVENDWLKKKVL
jgi:transposase-like protein